MDIIPFFTEARNVLDAHVRNSNKHINIYMYVGYKISLPHLMKYDLI